MLNCAKNRVTLIDYAEKNNSQNYSIHTKTVPKIAAVTLKEKNIYIYSFVIKIIIKITS